MTVMHGKTGSAGVCYSDIVPGSSNHKQFRLTPGGITCASGL